MADLPNPSYLSIVPTHGKKMLPILAQNFPDANQGELLGQLNIPLR
ncbi:hypothetical protein D082_25940 [Synechocystis sp. PCC 6714]|nr:hypothetical protein D082_25940 [Synechocystis sp. PCC 6714]